eukprot:9484749-Pyramimonas_sp.AAC.1
MWKCLETVMFSALAHEAQEMQFPMKLPWMLLGSYSQPRVVRAFGCWSKEFRARRGILAGCAHATTLLACVPQGLG